jgi:hypothetical protein
VYGGGVAGGRVGAVVVVVVGKMAST